ncbi:hypothetical protein FOZ63_009454, partial [Perkinsus olseni]
NRILEALFEASYGVYAIRFLQDRIGQQQGEGGVRKNNDERRRQDDNTTTIGIYNNNESDNIMHQQQQQWKLALLKEQIHDRRQKLHKELLLSRESWTPAPMTSSSLGRFGPTDHEVATDPDTTSSSSGMVMGAIGSPGYGPFTIIKLHHPLRLNDHNQQQQQQQQLLQYYSERGRMISLSDEYDGPITLMMAAEKKEEGIPSSLPCDDDSMVYVARGQLEHKDGMTIIQWQYDHHHHTASSSTTTPGSSSSTSTNKRTERWVKLDKLGIILPTSSPVDGGGGVGDNTLPDEHYVNDLVDEANITQRFSRPYPSPYRGSGAQWLGNISSLDNYKASG